MYINSDLQAPQSTNTATLYIIPYTYTYIKRNNKHFPEQYRIFRVLKQYVSHYYGPTNIINAHSLNLL